MRCCATPPDDVTSPSSPRTATANTAVDSPSAATATDYESYLLIPRLLELQRSLTAAAHDEMLFGVIHQGYELWFRLLNGDCLGAGTALRRVLLVEDVLHHQLACLETMSPEGFIEFRSPLTPASGFDR
ncbi:MAG: hypothetical protein JF887_06785 [Candidatus Dormibacteraeota bacterium]|uniref:Tryptophan 2,3-dioxygenase n=1 Tax=Candidatus Amunia macphersoniae TaxID=3127014 RepID=A0A934KQ20_9BACT|nr:hypothetical protein [Candidatus Dormibacteraeota bacterium]